MEFPQYPALSPNALQEAVTQESIRFQATYLWLEQQLPASFLDEVEAEMRIVIARNLLSFALQGQWIQIRSKERAAICCLDGPEAELNILKPFGKCAIRYYRTFVSKEPLPGETRKLRIGILYFRETDVSKKIDSKTQKELIQVAKKGHPDLTNEELTTLIQGLSPRFLRSLNEEGVKSAITLFFRAKGKDQCQYELKRNEEWKHQGLPSLQLLLAWSGVPKGGFLYRLVQVIHAHHLTLHSCIATFVDPSSCQNVMLLALNLHGREGKAAWEEANIDDWMRELLLTKYFALDDPVGTTFVQTGLLTGNEGHLVRNCISFVHQMLVAGDPNLYSLDRIVEGFCRHPELTVKLCQFFAWKFDPKQWDVQKSEQEKQVLSELIEQLDTGQAQNDMRRKEILRQGVCFVEYMLKTNFYRINKTSFSFRINPQLLTTLPYAREEKFPEIPFAIFFIRGMHFIGFNVRFRDLARGGMRTIIPSKRETFNNDRNNLFLEAYQLSLTQQKKNKDIPEGGAKTALLLKPTDVFQVEEEIFINELEEDGVSPHKIQEKLLMYQQEEKYAYINASQRCFIDSLLTLINCNSDGRLRASHIIDYWGKPEYIYLGPDENISNEMIDWIVNCAVEQNYTPGRAFISSSPTGGINHKQYGVTSFGVNVYLEEALHFLHIDPRTTPFTLKISGGPDGDVAGNEILNLYRFYPNTARLIALTDISGTIFDPQGLQLETVAELFHHTQSIRHYPAKLLSEGGFLLDLQRRKEESAYAISTLLLKKKGGEVIEEWLGGNEMNLLYRNHLHQTPVDIFIPAGGRPRTLNQENIESFLRKGEPTAKVIVEGANLYLTPDARRSLENLGVLILKDSTCNKGGVITSSLEVLANLCMSREEFLSVKEEYVKEVLNIIQTAALKEARLLLESHRKTGAFLTDLSEQVSKRISEFKDQIINHLSAESLSHDVDDLLIRCLIHYAPPLLRSRFLKKYLAIPDLHKKAIIGCYIASRLVYSKGLDWSPNIIDLLPTLANDPHLFEDK